MVDHRPEGQDSHSLAEGLDACPGSPRIVGVSIPALFDQSTQ